MKAYHAPYTDTHTQTDRHRQTQTDTDTDTDTHTHTHTHTSVCGSTKCYLLDLLCVFVTDEDNNWINVNAVEPFDGVRGNVEQTVTALYPKKKKKKKTEQTNSTNFKRLDNCHLLLRVVILLFIHQYLRKRCNSDSLS